MIWLRKHKGNEEFYKFFKNILGFTPRRTEIYQTAFIHKSKSVETLQGHRVNNERLEYLGDAVLGAIVAEYLYKKFFILPRGTFNKLNKLVSHSGKALLQRRRFLC